MLKFTRFALAVCVAAMISGVARAEEKPLASLLEGGELTKNFTTAGNWKLNDKGEVFLEPRAGESGWQRYDSYLWAKGEYTDFEIEFEYQVQKNGNSGFYFHVGDIKNPVGKGIEVQIYDSFEHKDLTKLNDHDSGGIIPGIPPTKNPSKPAGEWNKMHVTVKGNDLKVELNGEVVNEIKLDNPKIKDRPKTGAIGWQDHGLPLGLRNIKVRAL